ncbi:hypothetical protein C0991_009584 [Blastosporella zonata]|nr:hypothetical protein C0991_009584 [Blastosporella zonata]
MVYIRNTFWLAAAAETAAILSAEGFIPWPGVASRILKIFMPRGSGHGLCLTPLAMTGTLLTVVGYLLRLKCFRTLKELFTFEITVRENHKLITSGPYSLVRHPAYTGSVMIYFGLCCWFASRGSWLRESGILDMVAMKAFVSTFVVIYSKLILSIVQRIPEEDRLMKSSFGKEWEEWARRVRYRLIPGIY